MNEIDWTPAVAVLLAGLVVGAIVFWRVVRRGAAAAPAVPSLDAVRQRDLEGKYQALLQQLRELDAVAAKRTPEQAAAERRALEHEAARVLRDAERLVRSSPKPARSPQTAAPAAPAPAPASAMQGFLWGVGSVAAMGLLFYFVSQSASPRTEGGSLTGNTPTQGQPEGPAAEDAELAQQRAAVAKNPDDVEARLDLARLHLMRQDMMAVFQETQAVLQRSPGNPRALSYQALVRLAMGQAPQAESMLKQALAKDPQLLDGYLHLMLVYVRSERPGEAERVLADVSKRFPERAEAFKGLLGEMRARLKDEPPAAEAANGAEDPHARVGVGGGAGPAASSAKPPAAGKSVSGTLELDASIQGARFAGAIVFVTLREGGFGAGPPLAAKRLQASAFPMRFEIGSADSMTGETLPDDLLIEARIDSDGDPMTRPKTDPYGSADRVRAGTADVKIVLKPRTP